MFTLYVENNISFTQWRALLTVTLAEPLAEEVLFLACFDLTRETLPVLADALRNPMLRRFFLTLPFTSFAAWAMLSSESFRA